MDSNLMRLHFPAAAVTLCVLLWGGMVQTTSAQTYLFGRADFPLGTSPSSVASGDFNNDGAPDLAITDAVENKVAILLRNPDGTFATRVDYVVGSGPVSVTTGDFNGDGNLDLVVTNINDNSVSVLLGNGNGTFQQHVDYATGFEPRGIVTTDLNHDGKADLITGNGSLSVSVLLGNGDGTFQSHVEYPSAPGAGAGPGGALAVGDFDGDGIADLAVPAADQNAVSVLLGNGDGTFKPFVGYATGILPSAVAVGDFNGDGKLDLAVTNDGFLNGTQANSVSILLGNGDGTFQPHVDYVTGPSPIGVITADLNGDGKADLIVTNDNCGGSPCGFGSVSMLLGNGDGTFQTRRDYGTGTYPTSAIGDFNGDGKPDIAIAHQNCIGSPCDVGATLSILIGNGNGTFPGHLDYATPANPTSVTITDLNGDGKPDLIVSDSNGQNFQTVAVLLGNGDGTFQNHVDYLAGGGSPSATVGDFNGDARPDVAAVNISQNTVSILLGNGDGTLQSHVDYPTGPGPLQVITGDFNRDGRLDLAIVNGGSGFGNTLSILLGNGDGTFGPRSDFPAGMTARALVAGDFNRDGNLDLAVSNNNGPGGISVLLGNGNGTFLAPVPYSTGLFPVPIATGDLNGDGNLDLIVGNYTSGTPNTLAILLGNGDGSFRPHADFAAGFFPAWLAVGDLNADGKLDVAVASNAGIGVLLGNGDGTFLPRVNFPMGNSVVSTSVGDVTGRGQMDLVSANSGATVSVLLNSPVVSLFPAKLSFNNQPTGTTSPVRTVTLTNAAPTPLSIGAILVAGEFAQKSDCPIPPAKLAPTHNCAISVSFSPTVSGTRLGTLTITDSAPSSPQTVLLTGNLPAFGLAPTSLTYGSQLVGTTSLVQMVTLTNPGNVAINVNEIEVGGPNSSEFAESNTCGRTLAAGASCIISVTFAPSSRGSRTAKVSVFDDASNSPQTIGLAGTGIAPVVSLSVTALTFADQPVNTTSGPQPFTLSNTGDAALTVAGIVASGDFAQTNDCATPVGIGASCTVNVTFTPTLSGTRNGVVAITDNAAGSPQSVILRGTATPVNLSTASHSFGNQLVGTSSTAAMVTLTNVGMSSLTITGITIIGTNSGDFSQTNTCPISPTTLAAGLNCTISLTFTPTATGNRSAAVTITDNASDSPQSVSLTGTGTDFSIAAATGANCPSGGNCSTSATISAGQTATYNIQVSPVSGFNGSVSLTCTGAPGLSTCSVSPASVPPTGSSSYAFTVTVNNTSNVMTIPLMGPPSVLQLPILFGVPIFFTLTLMLLLLACVVTAARQTRRLVVPALALVLLSLGYMIGCGGSGPTVKSPINATITITGTSGGVNRTLVLSLLVNH